MTMDNRTRWLALYVLCLATLMIVLDVTIVGVALPSIRNSLGFSETSLAWVVNAYLLTYGGFLLLGGRLGDLFGHRRLFIGGIALFTAASLVCGLSNSQGMLVGARAVQGLGGAVASAVSLSLMVNLFTETADRAKAMGIFGFVASGGGSIGVLLGGVLTDALSWHWIFLVNAPIGVAVVLLSLRLLPETNANVASGRLDIAGALTVTASLMIAVYAIVNGNQNGWGSTETIGLLLGAAALLAAFLGIESRVGAPLMPLRMFRIRNVATADVVAVLWSASMFAWFFLSALYLQLVLGYSPLQVGLAFLPANLIMGAFSVSLSAKLVMRFGLKRPMAGGLLFGRRPRALHARPRRRQLPRGRAPEHGAPRCRRRDGVQSAAARGDGRRCARGVRARVGDGEHGVDDGRRARPRRARDRGGVPHQQPHGFGQRPPERARRRLPPRLPARRDLRGARRCDWIRLPARRRARSRRRGGAAGGVELVGASVSSVLFCRAKTEQRKDAGSGHSRDYGRDRGRRDATVCSRQNWALLADASTSARRASARPS
jgi:MFS family permease